LLEALASEERSIRRTVAIAMGRLGCPGAGDNLASSLSFDEGKDVFLRDGYARALEMLGKPGIDALIALADSGAQKDTDSVVEVYRGLRSQAAVDALIRILKNPHVSSPQRAELVRSAINYQFDPPLSLEPLVAYLSSQPKETWEVKKAMLEVLATSGTLKGATAETFRGAAVKDAEQKEAILVLRATAEGARQMGQLYAAGKLPGELRQEVVKALGMYASKDTAAARLLKEITKE